MSEPTQPTPTAASAERPHRAGSDVPFFVILGVIGGTYILLLIAMLLADVGYMVSEDTGEYPLPGVLEPIRPVLRPILPVIEALGEPEIQYSVKLSLISCTVTTVLSLWVAVPIGYLMSRQRFPGHSFIDALLDIPIVLPPLVVGLSLLILFQFPPFSYWGRQVIYQIPAVILAQFMVSAAFAVRTMRNTFDQIDIRHEQVALTLGCSKMQAFAYVTLPEARYGMLTAATLAWARALGEFGPLLIFAGTTRQKTEVLSTSVYLELSIGNLKGAVAVSLVMVFAAVLVLILMRLLGNRV